ncbi:nuclear export factor GLE1 [Phenylobacterium deserti]|uniref:Nuclear export factor GLE1 n=1 Tax=Phenylobacterium deserti TaxID=1914756 RepID=A0A328AT27_9CAUL|nr:nuclear export factor GLE1 [Phenylobacterium deserti]
MTCAALTFAGAAQAHVAADPKQAIAGSYQAVVFRAGHGCNDVHATTAIRVEIPAGMAAARPQPKPGWSLQIERASPGAPVRAVTWTGLLPADQFDEFAILFHLPKEAGTLYFPTIQTCQGAVARWTDIPQAGQTGRLEHPAPSVTVTTPEPAAPSAGHHH